MLQFVVTHLSGIWTTDEGEWLTGAEVAEPGRWFPSSEWSTDEGTCSGAYPVAVCVCYF